jgi:nicotinamidase-related amidase
MKNMVEGNSLLILLGMFFSAAVLTGAFSPAWAGGPKTALIVVDMQNDFASQGGLLYNPATEAIKPQIRLLINQARKEGLPVIFTQDWHRADDPEFEIWPPHAIEGSPGAAIIPELEVRQGDYTIRKRTYNAFFATDLDLLLRDLAIERLVICGTVSNICVLNTAGDAALWGYRVVIPQDAICALNEFDQQAALRQASFLYQAQIVTADQAFGEQMLSLPIKLDAKVPELRRTERATLLASKSALIVVDMQKDFAQKGGKLFVPGTKQTTAPIRSLIQKAREAGAPIIFTQDWHRADDPEFSIWPPHVVEDTVGAQVIDELEPQKGDYYIKKRTYDAFFGTDLDLLLRQKGVKEVLIVGTVSNICVLHTAGKARLSGYSVVLAEDAVSALNPFDQALALRQASFLYQAKIVNSKDITFSLR